MPYSFSPEKPDLHLPLRFDGSGTHFMVLEENKFPENHGDPAFPLKIISSDEAM
jgi:hypothetical protein